MPLLGPEAASLHRESIPSYGSLSSAAEALAAGGPIVRETQLQLTPGTRLLDRVREALRLRHRSRKTETAYVGRIRRFILFHGKRHPKEMGAPEIERFLSSLAVEGGVSASTQNQALAAILFLYRDVLGSQLPWMEGIVRARRPGRLPVVLTRQEVAALFGELAGRERLMATLLYGSGLRLLECIRLRVKEIDFAKREILVRAGKGDKDRVTMLPEAAREPLTFHLEGVRRQYESDLERGVRRGNAPGSDRQQVPERRAGVGVAIRVPGLAAVCGSGQRETSPPSPGRVGVTAGSAGSGTASQDPEARELPHAPAFLREPSTRGRYDIRTVQEFLGHRDVSTTMIYTHVLNRGGLGARSPADGL